MRVSVENVSVGDRIRLDGVDQGTVVFSTVTQEYSNGFPKTQWDYLEPGIMIEDDAIGLLFLSASQCCDGVLELLSDQSDEAPK